MVSERVEKIPPSGIREFFDLVLGMPEVISLGVGEPDFITPWRIREKAITALEEGYTSYTSNKGLQILREEISEHLERKYSLTYHPDREIIVTVGVSEGLDLSLRAILDPKDKVIVISPYYVAYPALVELNLGEVIYIETEEKDGFKINLDKLKRVMKVKPKAIILNYPSNPTGVTYTKEELEDIWEILEKEDILIISDEVYDELTYSGKHIPFSSLKRAKKRTVLLNGFSKGYAMTGFRLGFACGDEKIISAMTKIHSFSMLCAPIISQLAGCEALKAQKELSLMRSEYQKRRDFIVKELNSLGLSTHLPQGAFYCFSSIRKFKLNSLDFAKRLLMEEKVAVVPGRAFGKVYDDYIRISYANSLDNLKEASLRIGRFIDKINSIRR
ncbi:MAG: aminotransferase class I/II-fold pyridoxal phosphate-dependent enzyme [Candidatus Omnitrophica bacterium]|nr:aminotransferase class I/II-fold pyridoxal phosphate-dependent enzyme [Candidatus Omnitrophota bacterium]